MLSFPSQNDKKFFFSTGWMYLEKKTDSGDGKRTYFSVWPYFVMFSVPGASMGKVLKWA